MTHFTPISSAIGGALIGLSATLILAVHGKVAGISGLYGGLFQRTLQDRDFRLAFVLGLFAGGAVMLFARPSSFPSSPSHLPVWTIVAAGLLVGYGTRLGNGCTSGHGVCGLSRFSGRSLVATSTFMFVAGLTTFLVRHVGGLR